MIKGAIKWGAAVVASLGVHVAMVGPFIRATEPEPVDAAAPPEASIDIKSYRVSETTAEEVEPPSEAGQQSDLPEARMRQDAIPVDRVSALRTDVEAQAALAATGERTGSAELQATLAEPQAPEAAQQSLGKRGTVHQH